ncbi:hypothetical protein LG651_04545 [Tamlana sp. 62-3]|uniref:Secretion system C-terminal sorting domain-containing protein n=1 Tax=Neotamlana sargassicola TaxID=2883125 RepID=A0A9X1I436_9FLAO|nr:hypothetical protein [Tamlana sargassicola]MCB4807510.1 hypothetical protein [Tamlana sargassicola]
MKKDYNNIKKCIGIILLILSIAANAQLNNDIGSVEAYRILNERSNKTTSSASSPVIIKTTNSGFKKIRIEFNGVEGSFASRELLLGFSEKTSDGFDYGYDSESTLHADDLGLNLNGKNYGIQAYSQLTSKKVVKLNHQASGNHRFVINITELENIEEDQDIFLIDKMNNVYFDLSKGDGYEFYSIKGIFSDRFEIVFQEDSQTLHANNVSFTTKNMYLQRNINTFFAKQLINGASKLTVVNLQGQKILELFNVTQQDLESGISFNNFLSNTYVVLLQTKSHGILTKKVVVK